MTTTPEETVDQLRVKPSASNVTRSASHKTFPPVSRAVTHLTFVCRIVPKLSSVATEKREEEEIPAPNVVGIPRLVSVPSAVKLLEKKMTTLG